MLSLRHRLALPTNAGLGVASACAFILKRFQLAPGADSRQGGPAFNATIYEVALVVMSAYLAYLVSETLALSGIVTLFFTGICHAHYSYYSVTKEAAITLKRLFEFAAFLSEMFVFAYLGLQVGSCREALEMHGAIECGHLIWQKHSLAEKQSVAEAPMPVIGHD